MTKSVHIEISNIRRKPADILRRASDLGINLPCVVFDADSHGERNHNIGIGVYGAGYASPSTVGARRGCKPSGFGDGGYIVGTMSRMSQDEMACITIDGARLLGVSVVFTDSEG